VSVCAFDWGGEQTPPVLSSQQTFLVLFVFSDDAVCPPIAPDEQRFICGSTTLPCTPFFFLLDIYIGQWLPCWKCVAWTTVCVFVHTSLCPPVLVGKDSWVQATPNILPQEKARQHRGCSIVRSSVLFTIQETSAKAPNIKMKHTLHPLASNK